MSSLSLSLCVCSSLNEKICTKIPFQEFESDTIRSSEESDALEISCFRFASLYVYREIPSGFKFIYKEKNKKNKKYWCCFVYKMNHNHSLTHHRSHNAFCSIFYVLHVHKPFDEISQILSYRYKSCSQIKCQHVFTYTTQLLKG